MPTLTSSSAKNKINGSGGGIRADAGIDDHDMHLHNLVQKNRMSKTIPFVPVKIDEKTIQSGAKEVLSVVRPQWTKYDESKIKSKVFTEGLSNKLVGFFIEDNKEDIVIVKVFGTNTDNMIDRQAEIETMKILHERKCGAELYATFDNGICYQFMNGVTLEVEHCRDQAIYPLVAAEMARMHSEVEANYHLNNGSGATIAHRNNNNHKNSHYHNNHISYHHKSQIWSKLRQFAKLAEEIIATDPEFRERMEKLGVQAGWSAGAISELESIISAYPEIPVTFCHNDLIPRNIVYDEKRGRITFIDIEYAMYNYAPFDVANHFLEFAGVENIDYSKYPEQSFRHRWLAEYLKHLDVGDDGISIEKFDFWVQLCVPMSHLLWGLWGISYAKHSTIEFDYYGYVALRLSEFKKQIDTVRCLHQEVQVKSLVA